MLPCSQCAEISQEVKILSFVMSSDTSLKMFVQLRSDNQMVKSCEFGLDPRYKFKEDSHSEIQTNFVTTATSAN
jgi:hypothetical protein